MNNTEWKKVKLGDICTLKNGYSFKSSEYDPDKSGRYKVVTIKNVPGTRYINTDNCDTISELPSNIQSHQLLKISDILVSMTGNVGRISMVNSSNCLLNQRVGLLQLNCDIDPEFLYQSLSTGNFEQTMISLGHGGAQPNIGKGDIEGYELSIPNSIEEQHRIASLLSRFDELIQLHEFKADNLIKAKQQIMSDIFSGGLRDLSHINPDDYIQDNWVTVKLGDIAKVNNGKGIKKSDYLENGEYPIIGANGEIGRCNDYNVDHSVLTTGRVGTVGTIQKVNKAWVTDNTLIIDLLSTEVEYEYVYYILQNVDFTKITTGNAQPLVTATSIKNIEVKIPPTLDEQRKIANLLSSYDSLIELKRSQKQQVTNMKQQLMTQLLTNGGGRLIG